MRIEIGKKHHEQRLPYQTAKRKNITKPIRKFPVFAEKRSLKRLPETPKKGKEEGGKNEPR